jgi:polyhydroxybutyrate depolymerase
MRNVWLSSLLAVLAGCSSSAPSTSASSDDGGCATCGDYDPTPFGGARPVKVYVPSGYTGAPTPLVILLHGYSATGAEEDIYLGLRSVAESHTVLYAHPDGTLDSQGNEFWNATDACCNFDHASVDDSSYLASLVAEIGTRYRVDPKRVYFIGHSNGGFMSYRMACDHADLVASIVSIAGAMWLDPSRCTPSASVPVLEVHGTSDMVIAYGGGSTGAGGGQYPGATTTVADWAGFDGCATAPDTSSPNLDIDDSIAGAETTVTKYVSGCKSASEIDLWSIQGGVHVPGFNSSFGPMIFDYLLAHPKP